jgi:hypothetical protein
MDMDSAAVFLAASILTMMGFIVIVIGLIVINNLISKYWKDLGWFNSWKLIHGEPPRFVTQEEAKELDKTQEPKLK